MRSYPSSPPQHKLSATAIHSTLTSPSLSPAQTPTISALPTPLVSPLHSSFLSPPATPTDTPANPPPITPQRYTASTSPPTQPPQLPPASSSSPHPPPVLLRFLCFNLSPLRPATRFLLLSTGIFLFFMLNSYLEEYIFRVLPRFEYGWYITAFELTLFATFASVERAVSGEGGAGLAGMLSRKAPVRSHLAVAVAMTASRGLTNVSLQYLNYPTQVIFKSMKLLTVMAGSLCFLNAHFSASEYVSAVCLVASAVMFSYGDYAISHPAAAASAAATVLDTDELAVADAGLVDASTELAASLHVGVVIVLASLVADAFHATTQDTLMRGLGASTLETMLFTNLFSSLLAFAVVVLTGELSPALAYCLAHPAAYPLFILRAVIIYLGVLCFLLLIQSNGVVVATAVTTVRKILSIALSFVMFPKGWSGWYAVGFLAFCGGLASGLKRGGGGKSAEKAEGREDDVQPLLRSDKGGSTDEDSRGGGGGEHASKGGDGQLERGENGTNGVNGALSGGGRLRRDTSLHQMNGGSESLDDSNEFSIGEDGPLASDMEDNASRDTLR